MKSLPHHYTLQLGGGGASGYVLAAADGVPELRTAPPPEFDGPGDAWSPEHLLLAAVETCFLFTLRATAKASRVEFDSCAVTTEGTVDRVDGVTRFTEVVLRPQLILRPGTSPERARLAVEKAERACLVTASLATPVRIEAELS
jgi:organic hydroperoxide reductase OsmC/OhrA